MEATMVGSLPNSSGRPARAVLVVDDEAAIRELLQRSLNAYGLDAITAASGREAVELYRRHGGQIGVVLLDVQLPQQDGPQTLACLRALEPGLPCCFMSGNSGRYTQAELLALGAAHVFFKPFELETVALALRHLLGIPDRRREGRNCTAPEPISVSGRTAFIRDRCGGGLGIWLAEPAEVGTILTVQGRASAAPAGDIRLEVRHCRAEAPGWFVGCQFAA
jgi:two-component system OmpR family response regulator